MHDSRTGDTAQHLLRLARSGDVAAFDTLLAITRRIPALVARTQIGRRLQGKADSSDLVQEALLQIHRHFDYFRGSTEAEFAAWARSILAGLVANHVRRFLGTKQRDARLEQSLVSELNNSSCLVNRQLGAAVHSPSEQAVQHESAMLLANALETLPAHYRQVIILRHLDGLPFSEVASQMGLGR